MTVSGRDGQADVPDGQVENSIEQAQKHLWSLQNSDGHWCNELEGDNILESEYVLLHWFLGRQNEATVHRCCEQLRLSVNEEGGWSIFPGGPTDPNPSVKSYLCLKLAGDDPTARHMVEARAAILDAGGVEACNSFTKLLLCVFGLYSWDKAPAVPPELVRLPKWFPINLWEMSSWSRAIVVPLSVVWALKPHVELPPAEVGERFEIDELFLEGSDPRIRRPAPARSLSEAFWSRAFLVLDRLVKLAEGFGLFGPWRKGSIEQAQRWIEARLPKSAGLAAIFPSILNVVIAYRALGFAEDHPVIASQLRELKKLEVSEGDALKIQPCASPVWDTSLTMNALLESGIDPNDERLTSAMDWLLAKEVREPGDWAVKNPDGPIGGWYFEYSNEFYPDCDDTAEILAVLAQLDLSKGAERGDDDSESRFAGACLGAGQRAVAWQLSMQNRDGGWGAFDKECNRAFLEFIPFADHNAMLDPSTADVTSRSVEALLAQGVEVNSEPIRRAARFLEREQEPDGSWYGRWGANYVYGTWLALNALARIEEERVRVSGAPARWTQAQDSGLEWLLSIQNEDGGWGETLASYNDPSLKGVGESTSAQTSWALMGLMAGDAPRERVQGALGEGIAYLLRKQLADGSWFDEAWTGTGFPAVFYLRYPGYALYFPLQALSRYREWALSGD